MESINFFLPTWMFCMFLLCLVCHMPCFIYLLFDKNLNESAGACQGIIFNSSLLHREKEKMCVCLLSPLLNTASSSPSTWLYPLLFKKPWIVFFVFCISFPRYFTSYVMLYPFVLVSWIMICSVLLLAFFNIFVLLYFACIWMYFASTF